MKSNHIVHDSGSVEELVMRIREEADGGQTGTSNSYLFPICINLHLIKFCKWLTVFVFLSQG